MHFLAISETGSPNSNEWFWLLGLFISSIYCVDVNMKAFEPNTLAVKGHYFFIFLFLGIKV